MTESKICTCPSGDGSLRWPCPAHPAVDQADVAAKLTFINGRPAMCGCQVEYSDGGGEYSDVIYVTLCAKHSGSAILDIVATNRIALTQSSPAHELDPLGPAPHAEAFNEAPDEAIRPEQAEAERPEVVAYFDRNYPSTGDAFIWSNYEGSPYEPVMTVAQHDRIVGELRADRDSWAEQAEQRLADWDEMRKERDAALVEVERLSESKGDPVGSFEKCMKVMYERDENAKRLEVALARVAELEGKLTDWVHEGFRLNEALAVAKAQHSVPDDDMILQIFADNAEHSEQGDEHGYCIVREQHAQAIARKLLAAAPGNSAQHSVPEGWKLVPIEPLLNMMSDKDHDTRITAERQLLSILADVPGNSVPQAWIDVQAERRRQITAEGWTPEHDDLYCAAELPRAAAAYILNGANDEAPAIWPFVTKWWKPRDARSNYVRAGALILAEIERLDRARQGGRS